MPPILPTDIIPVTVDQTKIGLVHQRSGLERVTGRLSLKLTPSNEMEFIIEGSP